MREEIEIIKKYGQKCDLGVCPSKLKFEQLSFHFWAKLPIIKLLKFSSLLFHHFKNKIDAFACVINKF